MSAFESMELDVEGNVARITLNRPQVLNALDLQLKTELAAALREIRERTDVRAVLLTGAGRAFCAGGDIAEMDPTRTPQAGRQRMLALLHDVLIPLARLEKPVVAAVNGHAHGAGFSLALASDVVFAAEGAIFSLAFTRLGLVPDSGALYFLPRLVGLSRAKELVFTARRISAQEAHELGLVNRVVPDGDLLTVATDFARSLASGASVALGMAKRLLDQSPLLSLEDMAELEAYAQAIAMSTADHAEGVAAFMQKRTADFEGA